MWKAMNLVFLSSLGALACTFAADEATGPELRAPYPASVDEHRFDGDDTGGDVDIDADGDADADGDTAIDPEQNQIIPVGVCTDGVMQAEPEGLEDCEDVECLAEGACCQEVERSWIAGDFTTCTVPTDCGWARFGNGRDAVAVSDGWVELGPGGGSEVGLYSEPLVEVGGSPTLTFVAALDPESCLGTGCRQVVGVAMSAQDTISAGTGVVPMVGLVLDGELEVVHLVIAGEADLDIPVLTADLTRPLVYGLRIRPDGRVVAWVDLGDGADSTFVSTAALEWQGPAFRVVLFGRSEEGIAGRVGQVDLQRPVCDVPAGFERTGSPVLVPSAGEARVGRPSVARRPGASGYLMVFESGRRLAVATSEDGVVWVRAGGDFFTARPETQYGRVASRAPAIVSWGPRGGPAMLHLWFEGESEFLGEAIDGVPTNAIVHATSEDGLRWTTEPGEEVAFMGDTEVPWRTEVGEPSVVVMPDSSLRMVFVGRDPSTGATRLGLASSGDAKDWSVEEAPIELVGSEDVVFARDGIRQPMVTRRGDTLHLWYVGLSGARNAIGYAVSRPGNVSPIEWTDLGQVFAATEAWEASRVSGPAVLSVSPPSGDSDDAGNMGLLLMWYAAGRQGNERIGLASREIPTQLVSTLP
jgi:hypothetical protein